MQNMAGSAHRVRKPGAIEHLVRVRAMCTRHLGDARTRFERQQSAASQKPIASAEHDAPRLPESCTDVTLEARGPPEGKTVEDVRLLNSGANPENSWSYKGSPRIDPINQLSSARRQGGKGIAVTVR